MNVFCSHKHEQLLKRLFRPTCDRFLYRELYFCFSMSAIYYRCKCWSFFLNSTQPSCSFCANIHIQLLHCKLWSSFTTQLWVFHHWSVLWLMFTPGDGCYGDTRAPVRQWSRLTLPWHASGRESFTAEQTRRLSSQSMFYMWSSPLYEQLYPALPLKSQTKQTEASVNMTDALPLVSYVVRIEQVGGWVVIFLIGEEVSWS